MANVGVLDVKININDSGFQTKMKRAESAFSNLSAKVITFNQGLNLVSSSIKGFTRAIESIASPFIDAARVTENFQIRMRAALGSMEEANQLFQDMKRFASQVPFEFEQIMSSATRLSGVVTGGAAEVNQLMPIIADLAAYSGLTIEQATDQVIRMYSAGAGAADLFRERGVSAMLGFKAGVSYSAKETMDILISEYERADSRFRGLTGNLAGTWDGLVSMLKDKWFEFRNLIMEAGIFDYLKENLSDMNKRFGEWLEANKELIKQKVPEYLEKMKITIKTLYDFLGWLKDRVLDVISVIDKANTFILKIQGLDVDSSVRLEKLGKSFKEATDYAERMTRVMVGTDDPAVARYNNAKVLEQDLNIMKSELKKLIKTRDEMFNIWNDPLGVKKFKSSYGEGKKNYELMLKQIDAYEKLIPLYERAINKIRRTPPTEKAPLELYPPTNYGGILGDMSDIEAAFNEREKFVRPTGISDQTKTDLEKRIRAQEEFQTALRNMQMETLRLRKGDFAADLAELENWKNENIKRATELGQQTTAITQLYEARKAKIYADNRDRVRQIQEEEARQNREMLVKYFEDTGNNYGAKLQEIKNAYDEDLSYWQDMLEKKKISQEEFNAVSVGLDKQRIESAQRVMEEARKEGLSGLEKWAESTQSTQEIMTSAWMRMAEATSQGVADMITNWDEMIAKWGDAKTALRAALSEMLRDIANFIIRSAVLNGLKNLTNYSGAGSWFSGLFSSGAGTGGTPYIPALADGGIVSGPREGYPALLHGSEAVIPLDKLGNTGFGDINTNIVVNYQASNNEASDPAASKRNARDIADMINRAWDAKMYKEMQPGGMLNRTA